MSKLENLTVVFFLSGNISTTPRALQAIKTAVVHAKRVIVVCVSRHAKWQQLDQQLKEQLNIEVHTYLLSPPGFFSKIFLHGLFLFSRIMSTFFPENIRWAAWASEKSSIILGLVSGSWLNQATLFCAYGYGALFPVYFYAKNNSVPFVVDIEDYFPGEISDSGNIKEKKRRELLLNRIVSQSSAYTFASFLIGEEIKKLMTSPLGIKGENISNVFPMGEFIAAPARSTEHILHFVWFSQNISFGRGLEVIIPILNEHNHVLRLSLIGNMNPEFEQLFILGNENWIKVIPPLPQEQLHRYLSDADVGLAIEMTSANFNRDICVTNKMMAYIQAGLWVLATNTSGQKHFLSSYPEHGMLVEQTHIAMDVAVANILRNRNAILENREKRYAAAEKFSWENEEIKLLELWNKIV